MEPKEPFIWCMTEKPVAKRDGTLQCGYKWCGGCTRWGTTLKLDAIRELFNVPEIIKRGDIVIESSEYGHYAGELQIAKKDMKNTGFSNVVGKITEEDQKSRT